MSRKRLSKTIQKLYAHIRRTNKKFEKATREEKRVQIAKDVLLQLSLRRITPKSTYFTNESAELKFKDSKNGLDDGQYRQVQDILKETPRCEACAIGSVFVATVDRLDELTTRNMWAIDEKVDMVKYLSEKMELFNYEELELIEEIFEDYVRSKKPLSQRKRLEKMMEYIIKTKGAPLTMEGVYNEFKVDLDTSHSMTRGAW